MFPLKGRLRVGWRKSAVEHSSQGTQGELKKKISSREEKINLFPVALSASLGWQLWRSAGPRPGQAWSGARRTGG